MNLLKRKAKVLVGVKVSEIENGKETLLFECSCPPWGNVEIYQAKDYIVEMILKDTEKFIWER